MKSITYAQIAAGSKILVRCDLDVPLENGKILDTFRLTASLPTFNYIKEHGAMPVILGHIGRPQGIEPDLSTTILASFYDKQLGAGNYVLLENSRFDSREKNADISFAKELVQKSGAVLYVNDAFGVSHRADTTVVALPKVLTSYAGISLMNEINNIEKVIKDPKRPLVAVICGAKLETKKPLVKKFVEFADYVLIGGRIGLEWDTYIPSNLYLPSDYSDDQKFDIGIKTAETYVNILNRAGTVVWAGPMGKFEEEKYALGTNTIAQTISKSPAFSVVGGGDTIHALAKIGMVESFSFVSAGGGALLDYLVLGNLPGLKALGYNG